MDGISRLLTERAPYWQAWDVAQHISLKLVSFIAVVIRSVASCLLHVVTCNLQVVIYKFYRMGCGRGLTFVL